MGTESFILIYVYLKDHFILHTNASGEQVGAVLYQV